MSPGGSGGSGLQSEINVTPLVDVVLVLLIIFMVIAPLTLRGYDVDLPQDAPAPAPAEPDRRQIVLSIDPAGCPAFEPPGDAGLPGGCRVRLGDEPVELGDLERRVAEIFATRDDSQRVLFLSAHDRLNYEAVMRVLDIARSGVEGLRIGMMTAPARDTGGNVRRAPGRGAPGAAPAEAARVG